MAEHFDVLTIGRVGIDLYPLQDNVGLEKVETFSKSIGGSATNVAIAAAKHGRRTAVITRTGPDAFGRFVHEELTRLGVSDAFISEVPDLLTPLAFCENYPPDHFPLAVLPVADRAGPGDQTRGTRPGGHHRRRGLLVHGDRAVGRTQPVRAPRRLGRPGIGNSTPFWIWTTGRSSGPTNHWASEQVRAALPHVTIAIGNKEECEVAVGETEPRRAAEALLDAGVEIAIVKQGPKGVLGMTRDTVVEVPPTPIVPINGLGAGDSFGGAFCHGLLEGWDLETILRFANAAGAIVATRRECSTAMPTTDEVQQLLKEVQHV